MSLPEIVDTRRVARRPHGAARAGEGAHPPARRAQRRAPRAADGRGRPRTTRFDGPEGEVGLADLFEGRRQLIVYHFMFDPTWEDGCPSCTAGIDELSAGLPRPPARPRHDATRWSRARRSTKLERVEGASRAGTSRGTRRATATSTTTSASRSTSRAGAGDYNYRDVAEYEPAGRAVRADQPYEMPGRSAFLRPTTASSTPTRSTRAGSSATGGSYYFLDLTALGRQEEWEEPKGRQRPRGAARLRVLSAKRAARARIAAANASGASNGVKGPAPSSSTSSTAREEGVEPVGPGAGEERVVLLRQDRRRRADPCSGPARSR